MKHFSDIRKRAATGISEGDEFSVSRKFSRRDIELFGKMSRDDNPVHYDVEFAGFKKFNGTICHGLLVGSLLTEIGGQIGWLATRMEFNFKRPVYPGDTVRCTLKILSINEKGYAHAEADFTNQDNVVVIHAKLAGFLPNEHEKACLHRLKDT